jgi:hypothetical protein
MTMALLPSFYDQDVAGASLAYNATSPGAARDTLHPVLLNMGLWFGPPSKWGEASIIIKLRSSDVATLKQPQLKHNPQHI